jgi:hypothetical protein
MSYKAPNTSSIKASNGSFSKSSFNLTMLRLSVSCGPGGV